MLSYLPARRFAPFKVTCVLLVGMQIALVAGCGIGASGKSDYDRFKAGQKSFGDLISSAGGTATLEEQSKGKFRLNGWTINLSGGKVTDQIIDKMIEASRGAPVLDLNLSGTAITDAQLGKLNKGGVFAKTVNLDLSDTKITDEGLDKIDVAAVIMNLNLKGSSATKDGAMRLGKRKIANPSTPAPFKKQPEVRI